MWANVARLVTFFSIPLSTMAVFPLGWFPLFSVSKVPLVPFVVPLVPCVVPLVVVLPLLTSVVLAVGTLMIPPLFFMCRIQC